MQGKVSPNKAIQKSGPQKLNNYKKTLRFISNLGRKYSDVN